MNKNEPKAMNKNRRKAILGTATGVTAATIWAKPVVNSVILPAHAETSEDSGSSGDSNTTTTAAPARSCYYTSGGSSRMDANITEGEGFSPLDVIVPPAHAGKGGLTQFGPGTATSLGNGNWRVDIRNNKNSLTRGGVLSETDPYNALEPYEGLTGECGPYTDAQSWIGQVVKVTPTELWVELDRGIVRFNENCGSLPALDGCEGGGPVPLK